MAWAKFTARWSHTWRSLYQFPMGFLLLKVDERWHPTLRKVLEKLKARQEEKNDLIELEVSLGIHYKKRTLGMNNLIWAILDVEANERNREGLPVPGRPDGIWTAQDVYDEDMSRVFPSEWIVVQPDVLNKLPRFGVKVLVATPIEGTPLYRAKLVKTSSHWDTREAHEYIETRFNALAERGVSIINAADLALYWIQWRDRMNKDEIVLHEEETDVAEYRRRNPKCEATGDWIGPTMAAPNGSGELAHISAVGSGVTMTPEKIIASDWLHLKVDAHRKAHTEGWGAFLKAYPHLKFKVLRALKREELNGTGKGSNDNGHGSDARGSGAGGGGSEAPALADSRPGSP